ncbi:MAG: LCP family protein [Tissierellia bacterium]|nr:LCP family protein [Tissierellia bacterium]
MKKKFFMSFFISLIIFGGMYLSVWNKFVTAKSSLQLFDDKNNKGEIENIVEGNKIERVDLDEILFLLVGVDTTDTESFSKTEEKNGFTGYRTDTMMLCKVNFVDGSINIMSLPRDSRVKINGRNDKLNAAHSYGGMKLLLKTVREFTNLDVDYYVRVDYNAVKSLVDAIGGVEVDVPKNMIYNDTTRGKELHINIKKGIQTLDGQTSIEFLRYRQYPEGDIGRVHAQQYFMTEMIKQTLTPKNIFKLPQLLDVYLNNIDTNIDASVVYQGLTMAGNLDSEKLLTHTIAGVGQYIGDVSYFVVDEAGTKEIIEEVFGNYLLD